MLWARILDRRRGPSPPRLIVVDPRRTAAAAEADLHLAPRLGTNVALMNGLLLGRRDLFVVVPDAFLTETAGLADVVLPAAIWGEKTGCLTNAERTVQLALKAVEPPNEARADLDIFLDYAGRMDFRDKDGAPLVKWHDPESAFEHWKGCTRGSGIPWPCNAEHPEGAERLYTDGVFRTAAGECELYGHDLLTGAAITGEEYRARDPRGRAVLKAAEYVPPVEEPDATYPCWLTTGRVVYHFHTRTKTGRSKPLHEAAPEVFVQLPRRHRPPGHRRGRHGGGRLARRPHRGTRPDRRHPPRPRLHPVPLRLVGRRRPPGGGQRAHAHRLGSREQAAALQVRGGAGEPGMSAAGLRSYLGIVRAAETHLADALTLVADRHRAAPAGRSRGVSQRAWMASGAASRTGAARPSAVTKMASSPAACGEKKRTTSPS